MKRITLSDIGGATNTSGIPAMPDMYDTIKPSGDIISGSSDLLDDTLPDFIYKWYREEDDFPTYEDVVEEYDVYCSKDEYRNIVNELSNVVDECEYYGENNHSYLQLHDNHTLNQINVPDTSMYTDAEIDEIYYQLVDSKIAEFEEETGLELYLLGRSGRHVCVEDTADNVLMYSELRDLAERLEAEVIYDMNHLGLEEDNWWED